MSNATTKPAKSGKRRAEEIGGAMALALVLAWILGETGIDVPEEIVIAIATLIGSAASIISDYLPERDRGQGGPPSGGATAMLALVALLLVGCANVTKPETPAQRLAYADGQFSALVNTAADLREQGILTEAQVREIDPKIQRGNEALDAAWLALNQDLPDEALDYVRIVNRLLPEIRAALKEAQDDGG